MTRPGTPMTTTPSRAAGLQEHGITAAGDVFWNPTTSLLYTHSLLRGDAQLAEGGALVVDTGFHTGRSPHDKFVVRSRAPPTASGGGRSTSRSARTASRACATGSSRTSSSVTSTSSTPSPAPTRRTGWAFASLQRAPGTRSSPRRSSSTRRAEELSTYVAQALVLHAPEVDGDPDGGQHAERHLRRPPPVAGRGADRRHVLRRRDQEVDLHGHERPAAARRRPADALLRQHRRRRRVAVFFGLSGTGKTTLSADPSGR